MTSGRVSPSDLPDSPGQSRPYSPHKMQQNHHHHHQQQQQQRRALPTNGFHSARPPAVVASTAQHGTTAATAAAHPSSAVAVGFLPPTPLPPPPASANQLTATVKEVEAKLKPLPPNFDDDEDLEEVPVVRTYDVEGTPAIFSSRTSLSGLTFTDDERDEGIRDENEKVNYF